MVEIATFESESRRRLTTVMAIDICGYSRLAESNEDAAIKTIEIVYNVFEKTVLKFHGRVFNRAGDGFFAEFPSAADGAQAAMAFLAEIKARDTLSPNAPNVKVRIGLHVGDVVDQPNGDLLGHGVNIAARLQSEAEPNGILVSLHAVNLIRDKIDARFHRRGPMALKNIDEPVVAFDIFRGRSFFKNINRLWGRSRRISPLLMAGLASMFVIMWFGYLVLKQNHASELLQIASITDERLSQATDIATKNRASIVDERAVRMILQRMATSELSTDRVVFSLVEQGDIAGAVEKLERYYSENVSRLSTAERLQTLLNLGALSFENDPVKAKAFYLEALDINNSIFEVHKRLGRLHLKQSNYIDAQNHFNKALELGSDSQEEIILIKDHLNYSLLHERKAKEAVEAYKELLIEAQNLDSLVVISRVQTNLGIAHIIAGDLATAQDILVPVMTLQKQHGFDDERARALSAMSSLYERKGDLTQAAIYLEEGLEIEKSLERVSGITEFSLSIAQNYFYRGQLNDAELKFAEVLRYSREHQFTNGQIFSLIGQAAVDMRLGDMDKACAHVTDAAKLDKGYTDYRRFSRDIIEESGCQFTPLEL